MKVSQLLLLLSCFALAAGCEGTLENRVVLEGGRLSLVLPDGWVVEEEERGAATVISGPQGRLSIALMDEVPSAKEPRDLLTAVGAMTTDFTVREEADFPAEAVMGKEFIVTDSGGGAPHMGAVYVFDRDGKLCILTFATKLGELGDLLATFRAAAGSLRFLTVQ